MAVLDTVKTMKSNSKAMLSRAWSLRILRRSALSLTSPRPVSAEQIDGRSLLMETFAATDLKSDHMPGQIDDGTQRQLYTTHLRSGLVNVNLESVLPDNNSSYTPHDAVGKKNDIDADNRPFHQSTPIRVHGIARSTTMIPRSEFEFARSSARKRLDFSASLVHHSRAEASALSGALVNEIDVALEHTFEDLLETIDCFTKGSQVPRLQVDDHEQTLREAERLTADRSEGYARSVSTCCGLPTPQDISHRKHTRGRVIPDSRSMSISLSINNAAPVTPGADLQRYPNSMSSQSGPYALDCPFTEEDARPEIPIRASRRQHRAPGQRQNEASVYQHTSLDLGSDRILTLEDLRALLAAHPPEDEDEARPSSSIYSQDPNTFVRNYGPSAEDFATVRYEDETIDEDLTPAPLDIKKRRPTPPHLRLPGPPPAQALPRPPTYSKYSPLPPRPTYRKGQSESDVHRLIALEKLHNHSISEEQARERIREQHRIQDQNMISFRDALPPRISMFSKADTPRRINSQPSYNWRASVATEDLSPDPARGYGYRKLEAVYEAPEGFTESVETSHSDRSEIEKAFYRQANQTIREAESQRKAIWDNDSLTTEQRLDAANQLDAVLIDRIRREAQRVGYRFLEDTDDAAIIHRLSQTQGSWMPFHNLSLFPPPRPGYALKCATASRTDAPMRSDLKREGSLRAKVRGGLKQLGKAVLSMPPNPEKHPEAYSPGPASPQSSRAAGGLRISAPIAGEKEGAQRANVERGLGEREGSDWGRTASGARPGKLSRIL